MYRLSIAVLTALLAVLMLGCASGVGTSNPMTPSANEGSGVQSGLASQQLWGLWEISLDTSSGEVSIVPMRSAEFQANVTQFLQPPSSPINLLSVAIDPGQSDFANGLVVCTVTVRHPFPSLPQYRGFDVRGIVMGNATHTGLSGNGEYWPEIGELRLENADGYTRWWNQTEFTQYGTIFGYTPGKMATPGFFADGTVNGYRYFADGLAAEDPLSALDLASRGTYSVSPGVNSRLYRLQFPVVGGVADIRFGYAVTASYLEPDPSGAPDYPLDSFAITANMPEAFRIDVKDAGSTAFYENASNFGGALKLEIEVFDWGLAGASNVTDEIAGITLESPTLFDNLVNVDLGGALPGSSVYSRIFPILIPNVTPTGVTGQEVMIRVLSAHPTSYAPDYPGISGVPYPEGVPLTAYSLWTAMIATQSNNTAPQVGVIDGPSSVFEKEMSDYTLSYANDAQDGTNLTIRWDSDGDNDFADDLDGNNTDLAATLSWQTNGSYHVVARVLDSGGLHTDSAPFDVDVTYCPTEVYGPVSGYALQGAPPELMVRMDSAFLSAGPYASQVLVQCNRTDIKRFDTSGSSPWPGQPYITLQDSDASTFVTSLDVDDFSGRVIVAGRSNAWPANQFQVYDSSGAYLGAISVGSGRWVSAFDTDKNGDVWASTCQGSNTWLQHFVYQDSSPYYVEDTADQLDTSAQVNQTCNVWDIAISYSLRRLYLFHGNYNNGPAPYGEIYGFDMAPDGTLTLAVQNLTVFPTLVAGAYMDWVGFCTYGKIDIDHVSEVSDGCRIVAMARRYDGVPDTYFGLLDGDLNMVDLKSNPTLPGGYYAFSLGTDPDPAKRKMVATTYSTGTIYKAEAPSGW